MPASTRATRTRRSPSRSAEKACYGFKLLKAPHAQPTAVRTLRSSRVRPLPGHTAQPHAARHCAHTHHVVPDLRRARCRPAAPAGRPDRVEDAADAPRGHGRARAVERLDRASSHFGVGRAAPRAARPAPLRGTRRHTPHSVTCHTDKSDTRHRQGQGGAVPKSAYGAWQRRRMAPPLPYQRYYLNITTTRTRTPNERPVLGYRVCRPLAPIRITDPRRRDHCVPLQGRTVHTSITHHGAWCVVAVS